MLTEIIIYDKENKQEDYQYMAKNMHGEWVIGWIVIEKPWYSNPEDWTYYIVRNAYGAGGICGGCSDLGLEKIIIDKSTIIPYTQKAHVQFELDKGMRVRLDKAFYANIKDAPEDNTIAIISPGDTIPDLW